LIPLILKTDVERIRTLIAATENEESMPLDYYDFG
jgi:hypothetical protein